MVTAIKKPASTSLSPEQLMEKLTEDAAHDKLTYHQLWGAILWEVEVPNGVPTSVGMEWIVADPARFIRAVVNVTFFVRLTFWEILKAESNPRIRASQALGGWFMREFLCRRELVSELVDMGDPVVRENGEDVVNEDFMSRKEVFTELFVEFGAHDLNGWADAAESLGLSAKDIGQALIAHLEQAEYQEGIADVFRDFLENRKLWEKIDRGSLRNALLICAKKCPRLILRHATWLAIKGATGNSFVRQVIKEAAGGLKILRGVSLDALNFLGPELAPFFCAWILKDVPGSMKGAGVDEVGFLLGWCNAKDPAAVRECLEEIIKAGAGVNVVYRTVYQVTGPDSPHERLARQMLIEHGWAYGVMEVDDRKGGELAVWWKNVKYVQARSAHRPASLQTGVDVIFNPKTAIRIMSNVGTVHFELSDS